MVDRDPQTDSTQLKGAHDMHTQAHHHRDAIAAEPAPRVAVLKFKPGDARTMETWREELHSAQRSQLVRCAVAPWGVVSIEGRRVEPGEEIHVVASLKGLSATARARSAMLSELHEAIEARAVIHLDDEELERNRRREVRPGDPWTHRITCHKGQWLQTNAGVFDKGCHVRAEDFDEPAVPERVEPELRKLESLESLPRGWFVEIVKPERRIPGRAPVDGRARIEELVREGILEPIAGVDVEVSHG
jgi:hypothetical protein